jgi:hypothetical protein
MGRGLIGTEAGASAQLCSQAGAWEQEAKDLHPLVFCDGEPTHLISAVFSFKDA